MSHSSRLENPGNSRDYYHIEKDPRAPFADRYAIRARVDFESNGAKILTRGRADLAWQMTWSDHRGLAVNRGLFSCGVGDVAATGSDDRLPDRNRGVQGQMTCIECRRI